MLAERAERYFCVEIAIDLLEKNVKQPETINLFKRRLLNQGLLKRGEAEKESELVNQK